MEEKYVMKFRDRGDYLVFTWCIILACLVGFGITLGTNTINWRIFLYFIIGMYSSLVVCFWVKRNNRMWKESVLQKCPYCGSENTWKAGFYYGVNGTKQKYLCKNCGRGFRE